jgi:putative transposase
LNNRAALFVRGIAQDRLLLERISVLHAKLRAYGSPRIRRELTRVNVQFGRDRVARLMRENGIAAVRGKRKASPRAAPPVRRPEIKDLVHRIFDRPRPNMLWYTDLTMIKTGQGYLQAAVVLDAHGKRVIGWVTANHETSDTAYTAFRNAIAA